MEIYPRKKNCCPTGAWDADLIRAGAYPRLVAGGRNCPPDSFSVPPLFKSSRLTDQKKRYPNGYLFFWCEWRYRTFRKSKQYQWFWDFRITNFLALNSTQIYMVKAIVEKRSPFPIPENAVIRVEKPLFSSLYSPFRGVYGCFSMRKIAGGYGR